MAESVSEQEAFEGAVEALGESEREWGLAVARLVRVCSDASLTALLTRFRWPATDWTSSERANLTFGLHEWHAVRERGAEDVMALALSSGVWSSVSLRLGPIIHERPVGGSLAHLLDLRHLVAITRLTPDNVASLTQQYVPFDKDDEVILHLRLQQRMDDRIVNSEHIYQLSEEAASQVMSLTAKPEVVVSPVVPSAPARDTYFATKIFRGDSFERLVALLPVQWSVWGSSESQPAVLCLSTAHLYLLQARSPAPLDYALLRYHALVSLTRLSIGLFYHTFVLEASDAGNPVAYTFVTGDHAATHDFVLELREANSECENLRDPLHIRHEAREMISGLSQWEHYSWVWVPEGRVLLVVGTEVLLAEQGPYPADLAPGGARPRFRTVRQASLLDLTRVVVGAHMQLVFEGETWALTHATPAEQARTTRRLARLWHDQFKVDLAIEQL